MRWHCLPALVYSEQPVQENSSSYSPMNELLLLITALVSASFVVAGWKLGKERLYSVMIVFLILITAVGGKIVFFFGLARITIALTGADVTPPLHDALAIAFGPVPRIALASLCGYALSQSLNVYLYLSLKKRMRGRYLWLRANICNAIAQLLDSAVFFTIAFLGVVSFSDVSDIIFTGLAIKIVYMMFASPLLYLNRFEEEEDSEGNVVVTLK